MRGAVAALTLAAMCYGSVADAAAPSCFRRSEAVADQAIRYTTEIMVMSDTCRNPTYERFVQRNRLEVVNFQNLMKEHFRRGAGGRAAQAKLDTFLTHIANEAALRTGIQDIAQVCSVAVQFLATADALSGDAFKKYAESQVKEHGREYKFCKE